MKRLLLLSTLFIGAYAILGINNVFQRTDLKSIPIDSDYRFSNELNRLQYCR